MTRSNYAHRYMDGLRKGENGLYWLYRRLLYDMRYNEKDESRILLCLPQKKLILCCNHSSPIITRYGQTLTNYRFMYNKEATKA